MIVVVAEHQGGQVHRASWEAIAAAQRLGSPVTVLVPGHDVAAIAAALAGHSRRHCSGSQHGFEIVLHGGAFCTFVTSYIFSSVIHRFFAFNVASMAAAAACSPARRELTTFWQSWPPSARAR